MSIENIFNFNTDFRFKDIIRHPQLMMPFVDLFAALCGNGMLESMLEPHLRETGASTLDVGLSFLIFGCCYMVGNMFFGQVIIFTFQIYFTLPLTLADLEEIRLT